MDINTNAKETNSSTNNKSPDNDNKNDVSPIFYINIPDHEETVQYNTKNNSRAKPETNTTKEELEPVVYIDLPESSSSLSIFADENPNRSNVNHVLRANIPDTNLEVSRTAEETKQKIHPNEPTPVVYVDLPEQSNTRDPESSVNSEQHIQRNETRQTRPARPPRKYSMASTSTGSDRTASNPNLYSPNSPYSQRFPEPPPAYSDFRHCSAPGTSTASHSMENLNDDNCHHNLQTSAGDTRSDHNEASNDLNRCDMCTTSNSYQRFIRSRNDMTNNTCATQVQQPSPNMHNEYRLTELNLDPNPQRIGKDRRLLTCQHCGLRVVTVVLRQVGRFTHISAAPFFILCLWPLAGMFYCSKYHKHMNHYCPACSKHIGYEVPALGNTFTYVLKKPK